MEIGSALGNMRVHLIKGLPGQMAVNGQTGWAPAVGEIGRPGVWSGVVCLGGGRGGGGGAQREEVAGGHDQEPSPGEMLIGGRVRNLNLSLVNDRATVCQLPLSSVHQQTTR